MLFTIVAVDACPSPVVVVPSWCILSTHPVATAVVAAARSAPFKGWWQFFATASFFQVTLSDSGFGAFVAAGVTVFAPSDSVVAAAEAAGGGELPPHATSDARARGSGRTRARREEVDRMGAEHTRMGRTKTDLGRLAMYARAVDAPPPPPPPAYPPPAPGHAPRPPAKKSGNGCLVALSVVGGIILLGGLVTAFFVYRFVSSPAGQKLVSAVASGATLVSEATTAPGTKELRAIGCNPAMVIDGAQVLAIADALGDGGKTTVPPGEDRLAVVCATPRGATKPTCADVAATYVAAVGRAAAPFAVSVGASNGGKPQCEERFSADGVQILEDRGRR
jgi:hypothetical protein